MEKGDFVYRSLFFLIVLISASAFSQEESTQEVNLSKAWFKPEAIENYDNSVCGYLVDNYTKSYLKGGNNFTEEQFYISNGERKSVSWKNDENPGLGGVKWAESQPTEKNKFKIAYFDWYIGWREFHDYAFIPLPSEELNITDENYQEVLLKYKVNVMVQNDDLSRNYKMGYESQKLDLTKMNFDGRISSFISFDDNTYLIFDRGRDEPIYIFKYAGNDNAELTCKIKIKPTSSEVESVFESLPSLKNYRLSARNMMGSDGSCGGSANYLSSRVASMNTAFSDLTYQPWTISGSLENADLEEWGYSGTWNQQVWKRFLKEQDSSVEVLKQFYMKNYLINADAAMALSKHALGAPLNSFYFLSGPEPEAVINFDYSDGLKIKDFYEVIHLILDGATSDSIKVRLANYDKAIIARGDFLLYSTFRPEITELLLELGGNPNASNSQQGFGKTPLMYAAQFNQYETAKVLVRYGANTNARTTRPLISCNLLNTFEMTPLHYAVRYSSPDFIKLLLDNGASPFILAENNNKRPKAMETPLDWLHRYTAVDSLEKNPNIPDNKISEIEKLLDVSNQSELPNRVNEYVLEAEKEYQQGNIRSAYNKLSVALAIEPDNERALADMSLVGIKANSLGEAVSASIKLNLHSENQKRKESAMFNYELACKKFREENDKPYNLIYDGKSYCYKK